MTSSKRETERLRKQRERQQKVRERIKLERKPTRDDIARVLLHEWIIRFYKKNMMDKLEGDLDIIVSRLVEQGFDKKASYAVVDDLVEKYTKSNWQFFSKLHLRERNDPTNATGSG